MSITRNVTIDAALDDARREYAARNAGSLAHHQQATGAMPGGNTRSVLYYDPFPLTFARGEGAPAVGHRRPRICRLPRRVHRRHRRALAIPPSAAPSSAALDGGISLGGHNSFEPQFAEAVQARFPSMELVRFTNSGTEANLLAVSTAVAVTGRPQGDGVPRRLPRRRVHLLRRRRHQRPFDYVYGTYNDAEASLAVIEANAANLAAIILEPMLGGGGCIQAELPFLQMLRDAATRHGIVLIFDEVMTSRLSPGGLQQAVGVIPDLTTLGKYIGGGMSFGAFGGRAELMAHYDPRNPTALPHAGTFNNNVLTMSAGLAALTEVYTPAAAIALNAMGDDLRTRLNAAAVRHDVAMQFTGRGSMLAVHMRRGAIRNPADAAAGDMKARDLLFFDLQKAGLWIARRGMMALSLPLTAADITAMVDAVDEFAASRRHLLN